jgi:hypothetical protein
MVETRRAGQGRSQRPIDLQSKEANSTKRS